MTKQPSTPFAPFERRAGTYERDDDVVALLQYGTPILLDVPRHAQRLTLGKAADRDLVLTGEHVSAHHAILERRSRGLVVTDDASRNGLAFEVERNLGLGLRPTFEDQRATESGFPLTPGMTFVVGAEPDRYLALDDAMRAAFLALTEILGRDDEIKRATVGGETPSPSDLILAADGPGHLLITGPQGCGHEELARIVHRISKRRSQPLIERDRVPEDRAAQNALLAREASKATLVLHLGTNRKRLDPAFVSSMFMSSYQIRVIVTARTTNQARRALGHQYWRPLDHVALCPMAERRIAIHRLLDQLLAAQDSPLRVADLTPGNQRALLVCPWRKNLLALREAAVRLDAIARAGFSRKKAADLLGVPVQTFYHWFGGTVRLTKPLVPDRRASELIATLADRPPTAT